MSGNAHQVGTEPRTGWHGVGSLGMVAMIAIMVAASIVVGGSLSSSVTVWALLSLLIVAALFTLARTHRSPGWWMIWPVTGMSMVLFFHLVAPAASALVPGLLTVCVVYAGLTQPPWRPLTLVPGALVVLWSILDLALTASLIRLMIAATVLIAVGELPARLLRRLLLIQDALARAGELDPLTGVRNRQNLAQALEAKAGIAFVVMIDLDFFKRHNDEHGHLSGDTVLVDFADMLRRGSRSTDLVVRYGGEEFLVILEGVDADGVRTAVDRWTQTWRGHSSGLTFSAGVTNLDGPAALDRADRALYRAKAAGRNTTVTEYADDLADAAAADRHLDAIPHAIPDARLDHGAERSEPVPADR